MSPELLIDGYKLDHRRQYPDKTEVVVSNLTARSTRRGNKKDVVALGYQYWVKKILIKKWNKKFFKKPKDEVVARFRRMVNAYLGPDNEVGYEHIAALHDLGYLPVKILALPEGTVYPYRVPCLVIWNTKEEFFWLTNYLETILSTSIWGMSTSATTALEYRRLLEAYAMLTVGNTDFVKFQAHDFSFRGMFGLGAAKMSGFGHLAAGFVGTDTIPAIEFAEKWYKANVDTELVGCSVAATEHAVMCAGTKDGEDATFLRLIKILYPKGILSIVSDTWDFWRILNPKDGLLVKLKENILNRSGKVVIRPDTGDPVKIVTGDAKPLKVVSNTAIQQAVEEGYEYICSKGAYYFIDLGTSHPDTFFNIVEVPKEKVTPAMKGAIQCLYEIFGGTKTPKGYIALNEHIGLIYGDSITLQRAHKICELLEVMGFASTNIVFGIGSYTYAYVTRDTDGYAVKATFVKVDGEERAIFKAPKTGDGTKNSAKGLPAVFKDANGQFYLKDEATWDELLNCELVPIFEDGKLLREHSLSEIRSRMSQYV